MILGEMLRDWRKARHQPMEDLAPKIGISRDVLHRFEKGEAISDYRLVKILLFVFSEETDAEFAREEGQ